MPDTDEGWTLDDLEVSQDLIEAAATPRQRAMLAAARMFSAGLIEAVDARGDEACATICQLVAEVVRKAFDIAEGPP
jgi:hypothetical protein